MRDTDRRPRLYLDVDGVINTASPSGWGPVRNLTVRIPGVPNGGWSGTGTIIQHVRCAPRMLSALDGLRREFDVELVWVTTWTSRHIVRDYLVPAIGALEGGVVPFNGGDWTARHFWVAELDRQKARTVLADLRHFGETPFAWVDDSATAARSAWRVEEVAAAHRIPHLMIAPSARTGLTPAHIEQLRDFYQRASGWTPKDSPLLLRLDRAPYEREDRIGLTPEDDFSLWDKWDTARALAWGDLTDLRQIATAITSSPGGALDEDGLRTLRAGLQEAEPEPSVLNRALFAYWLAGVRALAGLSTPAEADDAGLLGRLIRQETGEDADKLLAYLLTGFYRPGLERLAEVIDGMRSPFDGAVGADDGHLGDERASEIIDRVLAGFDDDTIHAIAALDDSYDAWVRNLAEGEA